MKKHFFIIFLGILLGVLLSYYLIVNDQNAPQSLGLETGVICSLLGVLIGYIVFFTTLYFNKIVPWQQQSNHRLLLGLVGHYVISVVVSIGLIYLYALFKDEQQFFVMYENELIKLAILLFILVFIYEIIYFALFSYYSFAILQIETVKQERKQIDLQLKALKSQLSPHFLFNCLNTISSLVHKNKAIATLFIKKLVTMYHYTLESYNATLISLEEEINFLEAYRYLIMCRFENKLTIDIDLPKELMQTKIPPLTLQMLVENAIKHNRLSQNNPLQVLVYLKDDAICVHNNITEPVQRTTSFHIGLKNINSRYLLLVKKGIIVSNGTEFSVLIPIINE